jgi:hypothetical protein
VWDAALSFREGLPSLVADSFIPPSLASQAMRERAIWRAEGLGDAAEPAAVVPASYIRCAAWAVPLSWFLLVEPADRVADPALRYVTPLGAARRRVTAALQVLVRTIPDAPTVRSLVEVAAWLEQFPAQARIELDAGTVSLLMADADREDDESPRDLAIALAELTGGRPLPAAEAYERVLARWRPLQLRETAS